MRPVLLVLLLAACKAASPALPAEGSTRYVLVVDGKTVGPSTLVRGPDGVTARYTRQDGSQGVAELAFDRSAMLVRYRQAEAGESFAVEHGVARWRNSAEHGSQPWTRPAFYVPFDANPLNAGLLGRAL